MAISPLNSPALQGLQRGLQGVRRSAGEIASPRMLGGKFPTKDAARAMVELHQNEQQVASSAKALQAVNQTIGTLLDIKA